MNDLGFHCGSTAQKVGGNQPLMHWARWLKAVWCGRHACFTINDGADLGMLAPNQSLDRLGTVRQRVSVLTAENSLAVLKTPSFQRTGR